MKNRLPANRFRRPLLQALFLAALIATPSTAQAACSSPAGLEGDLRYDSVGKVYSYCDDTSWINWGSGGASAAGANREIQFNNSGALGASSNFKLMADDDLLLTGTYTGTASVPASGAGTRMFFDTQMGAFRAGRTTGTEWDNANIGGYSVAMGLNTIASTSGATALGYHSTANGLGAGSTAMGYYTTASGQASTAMGNSTTASGTESTAMGLSTTASGQHSTAIGRSTIAAGDYSTAIGREVNITATGDGSAAFGLSTTFSATDPQVSGSESFAIFMGNRSGYVMSDTQTFALIGGKIMIDGDSTAADRGCIRFEETTNKLQFSHDCSTYSDFGSGGGGGGALDDLSDAATDATNIFIGHEGGAFGASDQDNIALGFRALDSLSDVTGRFNVAIGNDSLTSNTAGDGNIAIGINTLTDNTIGLYNVAVGMQSLQSNTNGIRNVAVGQVSLFGNTNGSDNVALGAEALQTNVANNGNTAVGRSAMRYADDTSTGSFTDNTAVGYNALAGSTTASNNTGTSNTAVGALALDANTSGSTNVAIGFEALTDNTTGANNTAVGALSLSKNTTGSSNVAFGWLANGANTTGAQNTAIGREALASPTSGWNNTAVGYYALKGSSGAAGNNTAVGHNAMGSNQGDSNTALGLQAGALNLGDNNIFLGLNSGVNNTGNNNIFLGHMAGDLNTSGTGNIIIGYQVDAPTATTSDYLNIGNAIVGTMDNAAPFDSAVLTINGDLTITGTCTGCGGGGGTLSGLSDTTISSPTNGQCLTYNGSAWVNGSCGGTASPAGADREIQFNSGGALGASSTFKLMGDGDLLLTGTYGGGASAPASGAGTRMFFDTQRAAFRSGYVDSTQWDNSQLGGYSTAFGYNTTASSAYSVAMGNGTKAWLGAAATAMGYFTTAGGNYSTAMGSQTLASGNVATAMGYQTTSTALRSTAMGHGSDATGDYSTATGRSTTASGDYSVTMGGWTTAAGDYSLAAGKEVTITATGDSSFAFGLTTSAPNPDPQVSGAESFAIFMGDQSGVDVSASNVMVVMGGNVGIGQPSPNEGKLEVKGGTVCVDTNSDDSATSCIASESDKRLKKNIRELDYGLGAVMSLRPVSFDWRYDDPDVLKHYPLISRFTDHHQSIGLIAQDVQPIVPEAIEAETVGDGEVQYLQLDYTKLVPVLIKATQQQQAQIETLKAANENQKATIDELTARMRALESR